MTGRLVGYIRVSTVTQTHDQQRDALTAVGVQARDIFAEKVGGAARDRPEFDRLLAYVAPGDTIVVSSFDRFGRSTAQVFSTIDALLARGVQVRGLREQVDTSTAAGRMVAGLFTVIAEYEKALITERSAAAAAARKRRGIAGGRARALTAQQVENLAALRALGWQMQQIAAQYPKVSRATLYRYLKEIDARQDVA